MRYYLADIISDNMTATNIATAKLVAKQWDQNWTTFFDGPLFGAIVTPCAAIAFIFLTISTSLVIFAWAQDHSDKNLIKLFAPCFIFLLLVNGGGLTKTSIQGFRGISNSLDNIFIEKLEFDRNVNQKQQNLVGSQEVLGAIKKQGDTCKQSTGTPAEAQACLAQLNQTIEAGIASGKIKDDKLLGQLKNITGGAINSIPDPNASPMDKLKLVNKAITGIASRVVLGGFEIVVFGLLNLVTGAVQAIAEASMLLTALVSPLFIAAGLLPSGTKSLIALLASFWAIINYKFCYIIIVGLSAQVLIDDGGSTGIIMAMVTAIFAPIMAGILAAGGGMGFAKAAASVTGQAVGTAAKIASGGIL